MNAEFLVKRLFARVGLQVQRTPVALWEGDQVFAPLLAEAQGRSLLDPARLFFLHRVARAAAALDGEAAEVGVYRGGTAKLLAKTLAASKKPVRLFDTFTGLPPEDPARDKHRAGDFSDTSVDAVRKFLADCPNASLHPGLFPETGRAVEGARFCLVHVDVDLYKSVRDCCEFFYPRLVPGAFLLFDDYGQPNCPGARQAVDEFFSNKPEVPLPLPTGQCLVVRRS